MVKLGLNKDKTDWLLLPKGAKDKGSIYLDGYLYESLKEIKEVMRKKSVDIVILVSGYPGTGKSKLAEQIAAYWDPTFDEDRMYQNSKEFEDGVLEETQILKSHVLDEAWSGLSSSQVRGSVGRQFMNLMNTIRQKRLFIIVVLPDFFDLSKHMAIFRSRWLIHCYSEKFGEVGKFVAFDRDSKKDLYIKGKKDLNYSAKKFTFHGVFTKADPDNFDWQRYEDVVKKRSLHDVDHHNEHTTKPIQDRNKLLVYLRDRLKIPTSELAKEVGMNLKYVREVMNQERKTQEKENQKEVQI